VRQEARGPRSGENRRGQQDVVNEGTPPFALSGGLFGIKRASAFAPKGGGPPSLSSGLEPVGPFADSRYSPALPMLGSSRPGMGPRPRAFAKVPTAPPPRYSLSEVRREEREALRFWKGGEQSSRRRSRKRPAKHGTFVFSRRAPPTRRPSLTKRAKSSPPSSSKDCSLDYKDDRGWRVAAQGPAGEHARASWRVRGGRCVERSSAIHGNKGGDRGLWVEPSQEKCHRIGFRTPRNGKKYITERVAVLVGGPRRRVRHLPIGPIGSRAFWWAPR